MTEFKRYCKMFDKFLLHLQRRGMGYTLSTVHPSDVFFEEGGIKLSFFYLGTNYEQEGYVMYQSLLDGERQAYYDLYESAFLMLKRHEDIFKR